MNKRQRANRARMRRELREAKAKAQSVGFVLNRQAEEIRKLRQASNNAQYYLKVAVVAKDMVNDRDTYRLDMAYVPTGYGDVIHGRLELSREGLARLRDPEGALSLEVESLLRDSAELMAKQLGRILMVQLMEQASRRVLRPFLKLA